MDASPFKAKLTLARPSLSISQSEFGTDSADSARLKRYRCLDPVYFGVLFVINKAIGLITPPAGTVLNVASGVARVPMHDLIKGVMPFMLAELAVLFLLGCSPAWSWYRSR